ncbi:DUF4190 domain-containing protein [Kineococcus arenarius]|uniref:DUF4190 domain-containing protein n=1 Tax=Kineococcus sp. SYSU DK007 TaxID=3383128 RepID=UPI003D7D37AD
MSTPGNEYGNQYGNEHGNQYGGYQEQPYGGQPRNGAGLASLILGIVGLLLCWFLGIGIIPGIIGLILGIVGMKRAKRGLATNRGVAIAGVVTSVLAVIASAIVLAITIAVGTAFWNNGGADLTECLQNAGDDLAAQQQCQQEFNDNLGVTVE